MKLTILIIDGNPAVQALAVAALSKAGASVDSLADGQRAWVKISTSKPKIVFCATDVPGLDAYELCDRIKKEKALRQTIFVLLAPSDQRREITAKAQQSQIDKVLFKPFKSDQLRVLVEGLISNTNREISMPCALFIADDFLRRILEKTLTKRNCTYISFPNVQALAEKATESPFTATIVDAAATQDFRWYLSNTMGQLIVLFPDEAQHKGTVLPPGVKSMHRPLSLKQLSLAFEDVVPKVTSAKDVETRPLESNEQTMLAARISAAIYERLLTQESLKFRKWDEASTAVTAEVLRICRSFKE